MPTHQEFDTQLQDWLTRLSDAVSTEVHVVSTQESTVKEGHELLLDRPLPEFIPHPNPLAMAVDLQQGVLSYLRYSRPNRASQAGYVTHSGEIKWHSVLALNGHVLLFLLGELQSRLYTILYPGMSREQALAKRQEDLEEIVPIAPATAPDDDF